ncbi:Fungal chitosanase [Penicillium expansum]|nr:Fungal chitosanase [Penicillium expansum]
MQVLSTLILCSAGLALAYEVPANLQEIYKSHKAAKCENLLAKGFKAEQGAPSDTDYCGDIDGAIFLHSTSKGGAYADMDVDCDGAHNSEGSCSDDRSGQGVTAFQDEVKQFGIKDLDASIHPYVVFGNEGQKPSFMPDKHGMEPLSVMAIVCGGKLHYGIWGDTNGGVTTGEASISLAKLCYPNDKITGNNGHSAKDVLYIGFTGKGAVPGSKADWKAKNIKAFENSIKSLGDKLVAGLGSGGSKRLIKASTSSFTTSVRATTTTSSVPAGTSKACRTD